MKLLRRQSSKSNHFKFVLHVESLSPWPSSDGMLAIQWQRGSKRRGQTKGASPSADAGPATYLFDDTIVLPATLYRQPDSPDAYESKTMSLFVTQVDSKGKENGVVGGLELDLADFTSVQGRARQEYAVECSPDVWENLGGRPKIIISMNVVNGGKKYQEGESRASMATAETESFDGIPSTLSTEDEDYGLETDGGGKALQAVPEHSPIESRGSVGGPSRAAALAAEVGIRTDFTGQYDDDGFMIESDAPRNSAEEESRYVMTKTDMETAGSTSKPRHARKLSRDGTRSWTWRKNTGGSTRTAADSVQYDADADNQGQATANGGGVSHAELSAGAGNSAVSSLKTTTVPRTKDEQEISAAVAIAGERQLSGAGVVNEELKRELETVAALEHAIYNAGRKLLPKMMSGVGYQPNMEALQSPARRISRTILMMGQEQGSLFGAQAAESIRSSALIASADINLLSLWWATAVTLRFSFWGLSTADQNSYNAGMAQFSWISQTLIPTFRDLETFVFDLIRDHVWRAVMAWSSMDGDAVVAPSGTSKRRSTVGPLPIHGLAKILQIKGRKLSFPLDRKLKLSERAKSPSLRNDCNDDVRGGRGMSGDDAFADTVKQAMYQCLTALEIANVSLSYEDLPAPVPPPLMTLLRKLVMESIVERLDTELLHGLLENGLSRTKTIDGHANMDGRRFVGLSPDCFSFDSGAALKMAAGNLASWALDVGLYSSRFDTDTASDYINPTESDPRKVKGAYPFCKIRALADLIMAPKESLLDPDVRRAVAGSLRAVEIYAILRMYRPDRETRADTVPDRLLQQLKSESMQIDAARRKESNRQGDGSSVWKQYTPPFEMVMLDEGIIEPLTFEMSAESEDELDEIEKTSGSAHAQRFGLLRRLWQVQ